MIEKRNELLEIASNPDLHRAWLNARINHVPPATGDPVGEIHPASCDEALAAWHDVVFDGSISHENLEKAARLYENATVAKPEDLHAWIDAALIREALGQYDRAAERWQGAGRASKDTRVAEVNIRRLELMQQVNGNMDAVALAEIGSLYRMLGDRVQSRNFMSQAAAADPTSRETWLVLARLNEELGRFEEAVSAANRVLEISPDHVEAQAIVGRLQM